MSAALKWSHTILSKGLDTILPPRCVASGQLVDRQGMIAPQVWADLEFITAPLCTSCGVPFDFDSGEGVQCSGCMERPFPFETARAALKYDEQSRTMILGFKHADQTHVVKAFIPWLERAGEEMLKSADLLIPVPLHYRRLIARRYNQSAIIAQELSKATGVQADLHGLKRIRATATQGHLKAVERHKNVKAAFAVNPKSNIKDKTIVLVDDVFTTGATVKECTKVLLKAGAKAVHVLTLARVVREEFFD